MNTKYWLNSIIYILSSSENEWPIGTTFGKDDQFLWFKTRSSHDISAKILFQNEHKILVKFNNLHLEFKRERVAYWYNVWQG